MGLVPDPLLPEQRIYAEAVNDAMRKYRAAVAAAEKVRDAEIAEALKTCQQVLSTRKDA